MCNHVLQQVCKTHHQFGLPTWGNNYFISYFHNFHPQWAVSAKWQGKAEIGSCSHIFTRIASLLINCSRKIYQSCLSAFLLLQAKVVGPSFGDNELYNFNLWWLAISWCCAMWRNVAQCSGVLCNVKVCSNTLKSVDFFTPKTVSPKVLTGRRTRNMCKKVFPQKS